MFIFLPDLQELRIESDGKFYRDEHYKSIAKLTNLKVLHLSRWCKDVYGITPERLDELKTLKNLEGLRLDGYTDFKDKGFDFLKHFTKLKTLEISGVGGTDAEKMQTKEKLQKVLPNANVTLK